jgi:hypothetical protein
MERHLVIRGRYSDRTFTPDDPLPEAEGLAELIISPTSSDANRSVAEGFGNASGLRSGEELLERCRADRDEWGDR